MVAKKCLYLAPAIGIRLEQSGGAGTHMRGVIGAFRENGYDVMPVIGGDIFGNRNKLNTSPRSGESETKFTLRKVLKRLMPNKVRLLLRDIRTVMQDYQLQRLSFRKIESYKPDFIYERAAYLSTYGLRLAKKLQVPYFIETDGCMVEIISKDYGVFSESIGNRIERKKIKNADYVVVMNKMAVEIVAKKFNVPQKKFLVKALGIDIHHFNYEGSRVDELKNRYGLHNKFVIGFVGAVSTYHGVNYLITAAEYLIRFGKSDIIIVIVGWSKNAEVLKREAELKGLNNVIFTGGVDKSEVADYYKLFDVGVIPDCEPSIYPIKVLEYGIFKLCPLVPAYKVFDEIIVHDKTGYFFTPRNPDNLAETILAIQQKMVNVKSCGEGWYIYVKENFRWKDTVREIIKAVNSYERSPS